MNRSLFLLTGLVLASMAWLHAGELPKPQLESVPFTGGKEGYAVYRCPTLAVSTQGTVLAFCEGRVNSHKDEDDMDVVLKRSTDGGRTWGPLQVLLNDGRNPCKNQCPVVLPSGKKLLVWNSSSICGEFTSFLNQATIDQELIVRSAQVHALAPMMQFSVAPWRVLDAAHLAAVKQAVALRMRFTPRILELAQASAAAGSVPRWQRNWGGSVSLTPRNRGIRLPCEREPRSRGSSPRSGGEHLPLGRWTQRAPQQSWPRAMAGRIPCATRGVNMWD